MTDQLVRPRSIGSWVRSISGLFITKDNPLGLTPKELTILSALLTIAGEGIITKDVRETLSNETNQTMQVTINYINKLKKKGAIQPNDRIHPIFYKKKIVIEWNPEQFATQS